ncbi:MAG: hypothetical protein DRI83_02135 [Bacteroidetes bacterium]|nr:MAG: hypothetical protein DRI83_02135 [Bacteroidota bacterium]
MAKKEIIILKKQIERLEVKEFDLEAWKKFTIVMLARIFGDTSEKIRQIESIEYDYSSWSLRDTSGSSSYLDSCKKLGRKILEASIEELEAFGLPDNSGEDDKFFGLIIEALQDELKGAQFKALKDVILKTKNAGDMKDKVREILNDYDTGVPVDILTSILTNTVFKHELSK